jgi:hypothetical protein
MRVFFHRLDEPCARCGSLELGDPAVAGLFFSSKKTTPMCCFCFCFAVPCVAVTSKYFRVFSLVVNSPCYETPKNAITKSRGEIKIKQKQNKASD